MPCRRHFACWCRRQAPRPSRQLPWTHSIARPHLSRRTGGQGARHARWPVGPGLSGLPALARQGRPDGRAFRRRWSIPAPRRSTDAWRALAEPLTALQSLPDWAGMVTSAQPWTSLLQGFVPGAQGKPVGANQLQLGIERTFGGLGEAFGLRPDARAAASLARDADGQRRQTARPGRIPRGRGAGLGQGHAGPAAGTAGDGRARRARRIAARVHPLVGEGRSTGRCTRRCRVRAAWK